MHHLNDIFMQIYANNSSPLYRLAEMDWRCAEELPATATDAHPVPTESGLSATEIHAQYTHQLRPRLTEEEVPSEHLLRLPEDVVPMASTPGGGRREGQGAERTVSSGSPPVLTRLLLGVLVGTVCSPGTAA